MSSILVAYIPFFSHIHSKFICPSIYASILFGIELYHKMLFLDLLIASLTFRFSPVSPVPPYWCLPTAAATTSTTAGCGLVNCRGLPIFTTNITFYSTGSSGGPYQDHSTSTACCCCCLSNYPNYKQSIYSRWCGFRCHDNKQ